jgi:hypothetical protein
MHRTAALSFFCVACLVILASATPQAPAYRQPQNTPAPPKKRDELKQAQDAPEAPKGERLKRLEEMAERLAKLEQVVKKRVEHMSIKTETPSAAAAK